MKPEGDCGDSQVVDEFNPFPVLLGVSPEQVEGDQADYGLEEGRDVGGIVPEAVCEILEVIDDEGEADDDDADGAVGHDGSTLLDGNGLAHPCITVYECLSDIGQDLQVCAPPSEFRCVFDVS